MKTVLSLLTFAGLVSCQPTYDHPAYPHPGGPGNPGGGIGRPGAINPHRPDTFLGKPLPMAQAVCRSAGVRCRVVEIDGEPIPVTMDFIPDRLNFKVRNGRIIAVTKG